MILKGWFSLFPDDIKGVVALIVKIKGAISCVMILRGWLPLFPVSTPHELVDPKGCCFDSKDEGNHLVHHDVKGVVAPIPCTRWFPSSLLSKHHPLG